MTRFRLGIVEDNHRLRDGLKKGLEREGFDVIFACADATSALEQCINTEPDVILMDVQLDRSSGIVAAVQIREEFPRKPVVFYSIQDEDRYFDDFMESGILTHFAYVRKSNYLLPDMVAPLLRDAIGGRSFIDPEIEARLHQVKEKKASPMDLLEPNEAKVARMLANGMSNEQIARKMGFRDKRTISRINGQIYAVWGLNDNATDEKVARTRAALIVLQNRFIEWDESGNPVED